MLKTGYAADILSVVALGLSKIATCLFYEALFSQLQRRIIRALLATVIIWTLLSIFLVAIRCSSHPWRDITEQCSSLVHPPRPVPLLQYYPSNNDSTPVGRQSPASTSQPKSSSSSTPAGQSTTSASPSASKSWSSSPWAVASCTFVPKKPSYQNNPSNLVSL